MDRFGGKTPAPVSSSTGVLGIGVDRDGDMGVDSDRCVGVLAGTVTLEDEAGVVPIGCQENCEPIEGTTGVM